MSKEAKNNKSIYASTLGERKLIYVYSLPDSKSHDGCLKVGMTSYPGIEPPEELPPNDARLEKVARAREKEQMGQTGAKPNHLYAELAVRSSINIAGKTVWHPFQDYDVHHVLERSGIERVNFGGDVSAREWFRTSLDKVKAAIKAVKEWRLVMDSGSVGNNEEDIKFRPEQLAAIEQTQVCFSKSKNKKMLWDAKMRFGKTVTALETVKRFNFKRTIIVTHRPIVSTSWVDDHKKIFRKDDGTKNTFIGKFTRDGRTSVEFEKEKKEFLDKLIQNKEHFIYFASYQDLRGSKCVGGVFDKNECVFDIDWDFVIIDEAHEAPKLNAAKKSPPPSWAKKHAP